MLGIKFSKLSKHRKFNYKPVYYDEDREELHARVDEIKRGMGELDRDSDSAKSNIRRAYQSKQNDERYGSVSNSSLYKARVGLIAVILGVILYYLWDSNLLEIIFGSLNK